MKKTCRLFRYLIVLVLLTLHARGVVGESTAKSAIDRSIDVLVDQLSDGIAVGYPEFRSVSFGDLLDSDAQGEDAVVVFSIEGFGGSNYHAEYVAVFAAVPHAEVSTEQTRPYRLLALAQIGGRGWRTFDSRTVTIRSGSFAISGKKWAPEDPGCCPSIAINPNFAVEWGRITEVE
jgi:hypothetical protein